jgi:hypothetical protein
MKKILAVAVMLILGFAQLPARAQGSAGDRFGEVTASKCWIKTNFGYGMVALDDFKKASLPFIDTAIDLGWATASTSTGGWSLDGMVEIGMNLDAEHAFALRGEFLSASVFSGQANFENLQFTRKFQPIAIPISLNYYRYFAAGDQRYFITGGIGYYFGFVSFLQSSPGSYSSGTFTGRTVGGNLGFGSEWLISRNLGLEVTLNGRYARIPKVESDFYSNVTGEPGSRTAIVSSSDGNVFIGAEEDMSENDWHFVPVDFMGFDVRVGFNIYIL